MQLTPVVFRLFDQLTALLEGLPAEEYRFPVAVLSGASVGQHLRHVIECFQQLENGYYSGLVNYDRRQRNRLLEIDPGFALRHISALKETLAKPDRTLSLHAAFDDTPELCLCSSYYRELAHNLDHTVHHMAMIRAGLTTFSGVRLPEDFGVAHATIRYRKNIDHSLLHN
ncbi:hypothetical protein [Puia sp.]|jgi:hypothetical protein|uniref:hypothetical protein n=1 Tax=Puia sp. TaxID=2045100 RepID=UPI002F40C955